MKSTIWVVVISLVLPISAWTAIQDIQVSNQTSAGVTISWITDSDTTGEVHYSENPDLSNPITAYDERGGTFVGRTHYVTIGNMKKETSYYFEVVSGGEVDDNSGNYYTFKTMKENFYLPCILYGFVKQRDGTGAENAIIYLWITHDGVDSYLLSKRIPTDGSFVADIKGARSTETDDLFPSVNTGDPIHLRVVYGGNCSTSNDLVVESCGSPQGCGSLILNCAQSKTTTSTTTPISTQTTTSTSITYSTSSTSTVRPVPDTTTTSTFPSSTTTISSFWPLVYKKWWGVNKKRNLSLLRSFRDTIMARKDFGREYTFLLYNNSTEIVTLLNHYPSLTQKTEEVIDEILPGIHSLLNGRKMTLAKSQLDTIKSFLAGFETKASPQLKMEIKKVRKDIQEGKVFEQFKIQLVE